ncbi:AAA family ATPase [Bacillus haynesii]|uniref:AAA family ATPase n=1 Tax=Bacillus haynesii TaxID=1925021 RepID=UPI001593B9C5|nr:AAA family ATPase [Bacillus haynesii]NVB35413.1 AAA family ATPase [Bacillus licheniformis]MCY7778928.1 AAA family ATPase [Bacillus haynesii]MEC0672441.1 AAA family ATPase [Bacillus haynesii]MEC1419881.1 AAA family ATPase [Bacillus haynesii]MEC1468126.1 AAA family ATPase [Bacillus haynesii]
MFLKKLTLLREEVPSHAKYPFSIPAIQHLKELTFQKNVTFFVGENGSGKSTLLEAIADKCEFNTAGGGRNNTYEVYGSGSALGDYIRLSWLPKVTNGFFLRAESFYHFATHIDEVDITGFRSYGGRSLHEQSHGESFLSLFKHRFKEKGIYLLDEPEAALSPARQLAFLKIIHDLTKSDQAQFIIASHSPILLGYPEAEIFSFDGEQITEVNYEDTDHYTLTKYFLQHREKLLAELFLDDV